MGYAFVMLKPDAFHRCLMGEIISRLERKGFEICAMKFIQPDIAQIQFLYEEHRDKPFYPALIAFMMHGPVVPMVIRGPWGDIETKVKEFVNSIRAELAASDSNRNLIHASTKGKAGKEMRIFFDVDHDAFMERFAYERADQYWVYAPSEK